MSENCFHGVTGAKRQSWRTLSPRDVLEKLISQHPKDTESDLLKRFTDLVVEDQDRLVIIIEYWFANNYRSLTKQSPAWRREKIGVLAKTKEVVEVKKAIVSAIKEKADIMLLKLITPNGKPLGKCTGAECIKFGGWFVKVGTKVGATKIVDSVLTEKSIRAML